MSYRLAKIFIIQRKYIKFLFVKFKTLNFNKDYIPHRFIYLNSTKFRVKIKNIRINKMYGGGDRIRTYVGFPRRSYSPLHLTALPPLLKKNILVIFNYLYTIENCIKFLKDLFKYFFKHYIYTNYKL